MSVFFSPIYLLKPKMKIYEKKKINVVKYKFYVKIK